MALVKCSSESSQEGQEGQYSVLAHVYNIFIRLDARERTYNARQQYLISKYEIQKIIPDYSGGNICFGYDCGPINIGTINMHIYETEFPKYIQMPVMYFHRFYSAAELKDIRLTKETVMNIINTLSLYKQFSDVAKKMHQDIDPVDPITY